MEKLQAKIKRVWLQNKGRGDHRECAQRIMWILLAMVWRMCMSWIEIIDEDEGTGRLKELYEKYWDDSFGGVEKLMLRPWDMVEEDVTALHK